MLTGTFEGIIRDSDRETVRRLIESEVKFSFKVRCFYPTVYGDAMLFGMLFELF